MLQATVVHPFGPTLSYTSYFQERANSRVISVWHSEPQVLSHIPEAPCLLLIRDPRDVVLSAVDFIDKTEG